MSGNDYKRLKQEEDEEEEDSVFDPLLKLENGNVNNHNNNEIDNNNKYDIKSNINSIKNRILRITLSTSKSSKYSSTLPPSSIILTNNNNNNSNSHNNNNNSNHNISNNHRQILSSNSSDSITDSESSIDIKIKSNRKCQKQQSQEQQHQQILDIQQSTKIVRNKRCDNSTTDKKLNLSENLSHLTKKKRLIVFLVFVILIFCFNSSTIMTWTTTEKIPVLHNSHVPGMKGYLVWSDKCKMPNLDPYSPEVMKYFKRESYEECSKDQPLTSVKFNTTTNRYMLILDENLRYKFTRYGNQLSCCYQVIERNSTGKKADTNTILSACLSFSKTVQLPQTTDNILVKCKSGKKQTYIHGHAMMPERPEIRERIDSWKANDTAKPISVLLLGVDSISRINLIRAMPKTAQYLYDNEWFELSGYNKMDDNTFPNLMAILTGYNYTTGYHICKPITVGKLDKCPMIWKTFRDLGYVTAYGEDETSISTFNYAKVGFEKPPTDYYLRPFLIQAEHNFHKRLKSGLTFCLGYQHSADYVYDYALELATRYKDDPYFGLFWANTFSHNSISDCSSMDLKMVQYLEKFSDRGILNSSVIVFFSDHGMRFGPTRKLLSGHYEERLPFIFIWLPPWLKTKHPELVNALSVNKNRLTNPFDLHMTLKHILELSGRVKNLPKAPDCQNCQTLFKPVPQSRSCDEISIEDHWCTCIPYQSIYKKSTLVKKVSIFAIDYINNYIGAWKNGSIEHLCAKLHLHDVIASYRALLIGDIYPPNLESYRIVFTTNPGGGMFEATIRRFSDNDTLEVTGSISRLNIYASESKCVPDAGIKKYCHCTKHPSSRAAVRSPAG
ncbi:uncharacterized protein LOC129612520 isoform X4 [Condylostylus longicornis]|uniref:uncharacterized protein LOC129612520 isoform X4 n=1 Tax=Condylostylus longicornis TaxID=2530218 RepID=UPI00244E4411|nr:uncharacterized protein LOC129612520 isoform X4 [Condylostylus longicornis]